MKDFGKNLLWFTEFYGAKTHLAQAVNVSPAHIHNICRNRGDCTLQLAVRIADYLGISIQDMCMPHSAFKVKYTSVREELMSI